MHEGHHDHCCSGELEHSHNEGCCCGTHSHEHTHTHTHEHEHDKSHTHTHGECSCNGEATSQNETLALLDYMLKHNEHHTLELETIKEQLATMGHSEAAVQMESVITDYQKGNVRLAAILASLK